jgi:hypothetical protein
MVTRGYASLSYLHGAAETIKARGKPACLYYFGDYDPSGVDITRAVEQGIREFAPDADIEFQRIAVTEDQIITMNLPTRPTKASDSRSKNFAGESVEVDAIPPDTLRNLVRIAIEQHIDRDEYERLQVIEQQERLTLASVIQNLPEFEAKRLTVRELPNDEDRRMARSLKEKGFGNFGLQVLADLRVLKRDAPDLYEEIRKGKIETDEAMQIFEARKRV